MRSCGNFKKDKEDESVGSCHYRGYDCLLMLHIILALCLNVRGSLEFPGIHGVNAK